MRNWKIIRTEWHHIAIDEDTFHHNFGLPTDCYCEPEIDLLGEDRNGVEHRIIRHQDMRRGGKRG